MQCLNFCLACFRIEPIGPNVMFETVKSKKWQRELLAPGRPSSGRSNRRCNISLCNIATPVLMQHCNRKKKIMQCCNTVGYATLQQRSRCNIVNEKKDDANIDRLNISIYSIAWNKHHMQHYYILQHSGKKCWNVETSNI